MNRFLHCAALAFFILFSACESKTEQNPVGERIEVELGSKKLFVEIADSNEERQMGLMFRTSLQENTGMLFVFEQPSSRSFWMKNTNIPLDIGYFSSNGTLLEIYPLTPHSTQSVASSSDQIQMALEVPQGWFQKNNITPGSLLKWKNP
jgi:uncharacterized membrane protein (UPF0127 family)